MNLLQINKIVANRFMVKKRISSGAFGVVYLCQDALTNEYIALKVEKNGPEDTITLDREVHLLEHLRGLLGVPKIIWSGKDENNNCVAQQLLNRDLAYYIKHLKRFTLPCVVNIAIQLINIIEGIHNRGVIHRDIKPENILTGRDNDSNQVFIVDFGVSKFFRDSNRQHMYNMNQFKILILKYSPFRENKQFIGTTRYASIAAHRGQEIGRKDDLESLGYVFVYLMKGSLPWQNIKNVNDKEKTFVVGQMKEKIDTKQLCDKLPIEFTRYFDYVKKLNFKQAPEYKYLLQIFNRIGQQGGFENDKRFDWSEQHGGNTSSYHTNRKSSQHEESKMSNIHQKMVNFEQPQRQRVSPEVPRPQRVGNNSSQMAIQISSSNIIQHVGSQFNSGFHLNGSQSNIQKDLLKLPEPKSVQRSIARHRSAGIESEYSLISCQMSQQSSLLMNYLASNLSNNISRKSSKLSVAQQMVSASLQNNSHEIKNDNILQIQHNIISKKEKIHYNNESREKKKQFDTDGSYETQQEWDQFSQNLEERLKYLNIMSSNKHLKTKITQK